MATKITDTLTMEECKSRVLCCCLRGCRRRVRPWTHNEYARLSAACSYEECGDTAQEASTSRADMKVRSRIRQ
eukprot:3547289-Pleurochrysis_carterae.AAC.1